MNTQVNTVFKTKMNTVFIQELNTWPKNKKSRQTPVNQGVQLM